MDAAGGPLTVTIGPRPFGGRRDVAVLTGFTVALVAVSIVAVVAGLPGWIGIVYVSMAGAVWAQEFRRSWRISADRIEARRWFGWHAIDRSDVASITAARDEMGVRAVSFGAGPNALEIASDDMRVEPALAMAIAAFVERCEHDGASVDPAVPPLVTGSAVSSG